MRAGSRAAPDRKAIRSILSPRCSRNANPTCCSTLRRDPIRWRFRRARCRTAYARWLVRAVGPTAETETLAHLAEERGLGAMIVPNFSTGAVLMLCFARAAAAYFPAAEIVEMHRSGKKDKPSGTALATAANIERGGGARPEIHSVRLPGLIAHQEVMFSGPGELLTIRHDSLSRESFVPGIFAALRAVMQLRGLLVGLETIVDTLATARVTSST